MTERSVGSNPTPSATRAGSGRPARRSSGPIPRGRATIQQLTGWPTKRRGGRAAEGNRLLSGWSGKTGPRVRIPASPPFAGAYPRQTGPSRKSLLRRRDRLGVRVAPSIAFRATGAVGNPTQRTGDATADPAGRGSGDPAGRRGAVLRGSCAARSGRRAGRAAAARGAGAPQGLPADHPPIGGAGAGPAADRTASASGRHGPRGAGAGRDPGEVAGGQAAGRDQGRRQPGADR